MVDLGTAETVPSLQDFSLIKTYVDKFQSDYSLQTSSIAFSYFSLDHILSLQIDEIEDSITDTFYLLSKSHDSGHDRGIDAVYLDTSRTPNVVHIFNFKYTENFQKARGFFPSSEIDKILIFIHSIMQQDESLRENINPSLFSKVQEIWNLFQSQNPEFIIHICGNFYHAFEETEKRRFEREISKYTHFTIQYNIITDLVAKLLQKERQITNGRIKAIDRNLFEKSSGDIRALIVEIDARDLIRILLDDEETRDTVDLSDYSILKRFELLENAFEDNVRIYLKQRTRINQNIKATALSDDNHRFFFYNNGITLTCDLFSYPRGQRAPIIELKNIQVVNGGQTIHALYEAFQENHERFDNIEVLCRIYQTSNRELSISISEYTNSQNPVTSRDIRSNDYVQKKLEKELLAKGFYYERKKRQFQEQSKDKRIDAERAGQALMAFFTKLPAEAKDNKRSIFAEKYEDVFNDLVSADGVLLALFLLDEVEKKKIVARNGIINNLSLFETESFILHSSYYILYLLRVIADLQKIPLILTYKEKTIAYYAEALELIRESIRQEKEQLTKRKETYNHRVFFKGTKPKKYLDDLLEKWPDWREK